MLDGLEAGPSGHQSTRVDDTNSEAMAGWLTGNEAWASPARPKRNFTLFVHFELPFWVPMGFTKAALESSPETRYISALVRVRVNRAGIVLKKCCAVTVPNFSPLEPSREQAYAITSDDLPGIWAISAIPSSLPPPTSAPTSSPPPTAWAPIPPAAAHSPL